MATQIVQAYANLNTLWNTNAFGNIVKNVVQPTAPSTSTFIFTDRNDDNEDQQYICTTPYLTNITQLVLWFYASSLDDRANTITVLATGLTGSAPATQTQLLNSGTPQWFSKTFSYSASVPSEIKFSFLTGSLGAADEIDIYAAYVEVTGTFIGSPFLAFADI